MAAFSTLAMLAVGAAAVSGVRQQRRARREAEAQARKQENRARNAAEMEVNLQDTGADFSLGQAESEEERRTAGRRTTPRRSTVLPAGGVSASSVGGL